MFLPHNIKMVFVYLELDLKHVWDMNLASDFDADNANFSAWNEFQCLQCCYF